MPSAPGYVDALAFAERTCEILLSQLGEARDRGYIGEPVSQLEHALQAGHFAGTFYDNDSKIATLPVSRESAVLAALLHDVGHLSPHQFHEHMTDPAADGGTVTWGIVGHETIGAEYLFDLGLPKQICDLVAAHVEVKRYLCSRDRGYYERLSEASKSTLRHQGGPMSSSECEALEASDPLLPMKILVRMADEAAKDPTLVVPPLETYRDPLRMVIDDGREMKKLNA
ncbi:hypothetical protein DFJ74DRAFT_711899 [Hyaloraphidium curvatum]|nr:hypothetical protein DFJ74DRAFT_711899 [Hyaloraphidium curvatum]